MHKVIEAWLTSTTHFPASQNGVTGIMATMPLETHTYRKTWVMGGKQPSDRGQAVRVGSDPASALLPAPAYCPEQAYRLEE